jgi:hypothetical protein
MFVHLTILASVMVAINFIQAGMINTMQGLNWFLTFPLIVFVVGITIIAALAFWQRRPVTGEEELPKRESGCSVIVFISAYCIEQLPNASHGLALCSP